MDKIFSEALKSLFILHGIKILIGLVMAFAVTYATMYIMAEPGTRVALFGAAFTKSSDIINKKNAEIKKLTEENKSQAAELAQKKSEILELSSDYNNLKNGSNTEIEKLSNDYRDLSLKYNKLLPNDGADISSVFEELNWLLKYSPNPSVPSVSSFNWINEKCVVATKVTSKFWDRNLEKWAEGVKSCEVEIPISMMVSPRHGDPMSVSFNQDSRTVGSCTQVDSVMDIKNFYAVFKTAQDAHAAKNLLKSIIIPEACKLDDTSRVLNDGYAN